MEQNSCVLTAKVELPPLVPVKVPFPCGVHAEMKSSTKLRSTHHAQLTITSADDAVAFGTTKSECMDDTICTSTQEE